MLAHFDDNSKKNLGLFFRQKRLQAQVSQKELAALLELSSSQHISNVERGASCYTATQINRVVEVLDMNLREVELIFYEELTSSFKRKWRNAFTSIY